MGLTARAFERRVRCVAALRTIFSVAVIIAIGASSPRADEVTAARATALRLAQANGLPPADIPGATGDQQGADPAALVVRIDRLENQLRAANGAIEELQNQQHRLEEQLKKFQEDVEFRLNGGKGAAPVAEPTAPPAKPVKRSDAFDPDADPNAVGAPRPIGTTPPSPPLATAPPVVAAPLDLSHNSANPALPAGPLAGAEPTVIPGIAGPPDDPREQFNAALDVYHLGQYDQAEQRFRAFLAKNPASRQASEATFYLGESYLQRSRPREAAEQYLKVSTDYPKSPRAPEAMLRLGQSLSALGNNDQACATFREIIRRYPTSAVVLRKSVERETQKDHC